MEGSHRRSWLAFCHRKRPFPGGCDRLPVDKGWLGALATVMMSRVNVASRQQIPSSAGTSRASSGGGTETLPHAGRPASPAATRVSGRTWKDPRLFVGVALVAVCVLVGARLLESADDSVAVWSVRGDMSAGSPVAITDLERVNLRFGSAELAERYLSAEDVLPAGTVLGRDLTGGELLPRAALEGGDAVELVEVPVAIAAEAVPATLRTGELVDVWVTPETETGEVPRAVRVLAQVRVMAVPADRSALGPSSTRQVLVGLPAEEEGRLPAALAQLSAGTAVIVRRG